MAVPDDFAPACTADYLEKEYWDRRFQEEEHYEWCRGYADFAHLTRPHMRPTDAVLLLGCGNSALTEQLHSDGFPNITSIDISPVAIDRLRAKLDAAHFPGLSWAVADMLDLGAAVPDGTFDIVIEKGTLDVLFVDNPSPWRLTDEVALRARKTLRGVYAALKPGGTFLSITFAQPHFRTPVLQAAPLDWSVQVETFGDDWKYFVYAVRKPSAAAAAAAPHLAGASVSGADDATAGAAVAMSSGGRPPPDAAEAVLRGLGYDPERYRVPGTSSTEHQHMDDDSYLLGMDV